jgi:hypothetical protein
LLVRRQALDLGERVAIEAVRVPEPLRQQLQPRRSLVICKRWLLWRWNRAGGSILHALQRSAHAGGQTRVAAALVSPARAAVAIGSDTAAGDGSQQPPRAVIGLSLGGDPAALAILDRALPLERLRARRASGRAPRNGGAACSCFTVERRDRLRSQRLLSRGWAARRREHRVAPGEPHDA